MKYIFIVVLSCFTTVSLAQSTSKIDSLSFCFKKYAVPAGCTAQSEYQLKCDDYSMVWLYMNEQMMQQSMPDKFIDQMADKLQDFRKQPIKCYLLGKEAKGYKISFKNNKGTGYQIIGYGTANGQPVMVQLSLDKEPKTTNDLPEFAKQIIRLAE